MLHKRIWLSCDRGDIDDTPACENTFVLEGLEITHAWVQAHARDHGWVRRDGMDLCPNHKEKRKRNGN